jgi:quercetin dioxygenase-like cupin family protein
VEVLRIFSDESGESHFEEVDVAVVESDFAPPAPPLLIADRLDAKSLILCTMPKGWHGVAHPTPARQYFFMLSGLLEVSVSDGETRHVRPGAIVLLEDTSGKGHVTKAIGDTEARCAFVQIP